MNRRHLLSTLALLPLSLSVSLLHAEVEEEALPFWVAGGKNHGTVARQVEWALGSFGLEWAGMKYWGVEKDGELIYGRPGKDETEKGTEYFFISHRTEIGVVNGKKLLRLELDNSNEDKAPPRALFFGLELDHAPDFKEFAGFFYLAGAKGETLTSVFEKGNEKAPEGRLIVTAQPAGKGAARTYEFAFSKGVPELVAEVRAAKKK